MNAYAVAGAMICLLGLAMFLPQLWTDLLEWTRRDDR